MKYRGPDPTEVWGRTLISLSRHLDQAHRRSLLFSLSIVSLHHIFACYSSVEHTGSSSPFEICDFFFSMRTALLYNLCSKMKATARK